MSYNTLTSFLLNLGLLRLVSFFSSSSYLFSFTKPAHDNLGGSVSSPLPFLPFPSLGSSQFGILPSTLASFCSVMKYLSLAHKMLAQVSWCNSISHRIALISMVSYPHTLVTLFMKLIHPTVLGKMVTFVCVRKDGRSHVCPCVEFGYESKLLLNTSVDKMNCSPTESLMNPAITTLYFHT